jgi:hypothetical protein
MTEVGRAALLLKFSRGLAEIGIEFFQNLEAGLFDVNIEVFQYSRSHTVALSQ